jgi:hypothetical protein
MHVCELKWSPEDIVVLFWLAYRVLYLQESVVFCLHTFRVRIKTALMDFFWFQQMVVRISFERDLISERLSVWIFNVTDPCQLRF